MQIHDDQAANRSSSRINQNHSENSTLTDLQIPKSTENTILGT